jgi:hypothetical protein
MVDCTVEFLPGITDHVLRITLKNNKDFIKTIDKDKKRVSQQQKSINRKDRRD